MLCYDRSPLGPVLVADRSTPPFPPVGEAPSMAACIKLFTEPPLLEPSFAEGSIAWSDADRPFCLRLTKIIRSDCYGQKIFY
jgi:hypothetical protein